MESTLYYQFQVTKYQTREKLFPPRRDLYDTQKRTLSWLATSFEVFDIVMKYCVECLTLCYLNLKQYDFRIRNYGLKWGDFHLISRHSLNLNFFSIEEFTLIVASWVIRARLQEIRRFVLEFKARYFFLNSYFWCFLFEKSNLRVQINNTLNLECKEVRDQFLENLDFPIHFL